MVNGETALVWWDGKTEQIDMVLQMQGSMQSAAWIMPTPAGTTLSLGDQAAFPKLAMAVKPRVEQKTRWRLWPRLGVGSGGGDKGGAFPGTQAPGAGLSVQQATIGPFQVATLSATDARDVDRWLSDNGFPSKPQLVPTFQSYLDQKWQIQAAKLVPQADNTAFSNDLPPLRLSFATTQVVYPIKLSHHARTSQQVTLYLAAPHQMAISTQAAATNSLTMTFAGRVPASTVGRSHGLGAASEVYLTAYEGMLQPSEITTDYTFTQTTDQPYQRVEYVYVERGHWIGPVALLLAVAALQIGVAMVVLAITRPGQRRR